MAPDGQVLAPNLHESESIPEAARAEIDRLLSSGDLFRYTAPSDAPVALLEKEFAELLGARFALAVSSCSAALFLCLKALDLPKGAKVLIPAFTFAAVPSSVVHAECEPVLVEVGANYRVDMADFAAKLPQASAVLISHMRGHTSDMDAIMALCDAAGVPVIEDAAHSLGTLWSGRQIGTIGKAGCFSFQSYKLVNAGEGGIMVTDDPEIAARAIIMSGAYEENWKKHPGLSNSCAHWQNKLPLYNLRMQNLSAAVIRPQLPLVADRVTKGRANYDHVAAQLNDCPHLVVPPALPGEERAPDSIQFNLKGEWSDDEARALQAAAKARGVTVQVFGLSDGNARAFWNWQFLGDVPELPQTRAMLMRACDVRLPTRLSQAELDFVAGVILDAVAEVKG
ncbi:aminotransferase class I/II-fold pyridoxal phosphate-dependent enzyme [Xinfangfangia sp. CPCC 101601]|uniref:Aminotransferase class I/II-fold pyridoxal phosphate-dependent enzyme n=1 Tax=Pseudogemmobacter lacusdianii TaxID=3069608 RepID=A0ABU0VVK9_9RHOB|nr:aminotransferase class I/II-fold pyridoxal phosphate-dependent enzyme [Xinfangfangia sp. CPCC 101601]MDQ2065718.1 aminotransferase class I/II-fold pyridoxal phosphate-dependent enzyme [Xinfangfangia sp. CPCC 101601]